MMEKAWKGLVDSGGLGCVQKWTDQRLQSLANVCVTRYIT